VRLGLDTERIRACLGRRMWSGGGGRSVDNIDVIWWAVIEPPLRGHVHVHALAEHTAMGHRGPLARGPYPLKLFSNLSHHLKFKTKVFPMSKNTHILQVDSLKYREQLPFWPNFKFPLDCKLQILEKIKFESSLNFKRVQTLWENLINSLKFHLHKSEISWVHLYVRF
jgi:hypothetical protein